MAGVRGFQVWRRPPFDQPQVRYTKAVIPDHVRVAISGRRDQEPSFFPVIVCATRPSTPAQSLSKGSRVVVVGRLQQRAWTAEDGSARSVVEVVADELGLSLRWATVSTTTATSS